MSVVPVPVPEQVAQCECEGSRLCRSRGAPQQQEIPRRFWVIKLVLVTPSGTWTRDGTAIGGKGKVLTFLARPHLADRTPYLAQCRANSVDPFFLFLFSIPLQTIGAKSNSVLNDSCIRLHKRQEREGNKFKGCLASICRVRSEPGPPSNSRPKLEGRALLRTARVLRRARPLRLHQESQKGRGSLSLEDTRPAAS